MNIDSIVNSIFNSVTYIIPTDVCDECWLVDCGDIDTVYSNGYKVIGVLLTHGHFDHIYGLNRLLEINSQAKIYTNEEGANSLIDPKKNFSKYHEDVENFVFSSPQNIYIIKEEFFYINGLGEVKVLLTPGHDPSCLSFIIRNYLFTGDAYIPGFKTVTTFPRSNKEQATESFLRLQQYERNGYMICPGHGELIEKIYNKL